MYRVEAYLNWVESEQVWECVTEDGKFRATDRNMNLAEGRLLSKVAEVHGTKYSVRVVF